MDRSRAEQSAEVIVVIGHHPEYLRVGGDLDAVVFDIETDVWNAMSETDRWDANRQFLDDVIARDARIVLATPPDAIKQRPSYLARELAYLISLGYQIRANGALWELVR